MPPVLELRLWALVMAAAVACGGSGGVPADCPNDLPPACPSPAPTFAADAQPAIAAVCLTCHQPGGLEANRPFQTWKQIYDQRTTILNQLHACRMPPADAPQPTDAQRAALLGWLVCGAPND